jgi:hypothetical protein
MTLASHSIPITRAVLAIRGKRFTLESSPDGFRLVLGTSGYFQAITNSVRLRAFIFADII